MIFELFFPHFGPHGHPSVEVSIFDAWRDLIGLEGDVFILLLNLVFLGLDQLLDPLISPGNVFLAHQEREVHWHGDLPAVFLF